MWFTTHNHDTSAIPRNAFKNLPVNGPIYARSYVSIPSYIVITHAISRNAITELHDTGIINMVELCVICSVGIAELDLIP